MSLLRETAGVTAVEFAFVLGPLLLILTGIVKVGEVMWVQNLLNYAVDEAARCGAVNPTICATSDEIQTYAANTAGPGIPATYIASTGDCGVSVAGSYTVSVSAPFLSFSIPLSANACYPKS